MTIVTSDARTCIGGAPAAERTYDDVRRDRDRRLDEVIRVFDQARAYAKSGENKTTDWNLEALLPIVDRKLPLIVSVAREQDIKIASVGNAQRMRGGHRA